MAKLQEMTQDQIGQALRSAMERQVPVTVTLKRNDTWTSCHTRIMAVGDMHLLLEKPRVHDGMEPPRITPAEKIGLSLKLKHYKHVFTVTAVGVEELSDGPGGPVEVLSVCLPSSMHRLQRRAFIRAEVPHGRVVRAAFWLGGHENEPANGDLERPIWSGRLTNISAGGFQLASDSAEGIWEQVVGETVGVRLAFEAGSESVYADAQFRRVDRVNGRTLLGFQFIGLSQDRKGRQGLQYISGKVAEYHRHIESAGGRRR